jgi:hypothetical protein
MSDGPTIHPDAWDGALSDDNRQIVFNLGVIAEELRRIRINLEDLNSVTAAGGNGGNPRTSYRT